MPGAAGGVENVEQPFKIKAHASTTLNLVKLLTILFKVKIPLFLNGL
jgi:hypothetical protein